jgi:hypothetical protein
MRIESHKPRQPVTITIEFDNVEEVRGLLEELQTWKPTGGWSQTSEEFFSGLKSALLEVD